MIATDPSTADATRAIADRLKQRSERTFHVNGPKPPPSKEWKTKLDNLVDYYAPGAKVMVTGSGKGAMTKGDTIYISPDVPMHELEQKVAHEAGHFAENSSGIDSKTLYPPSSTMRWADMPEEKFAEAYRAWRQGGYGAEISPELASLFEQHFDRATGRRK